ncbi:N-6 DNA methylase [[Pseudomonas] boreopolis]|uniref:N-6 DNA methylase n=1 Tax=Xanthomonas boreopolis TaxID=86183 RepID=UPI003D9BA76A
MSRNPRKALSDAIRYHARVSKLDRSPAQALNTMIAGLFNILGCRPLSMYHTIDESYYVNFKAPERMKEIESISAMTTAYLEAVKANQPFHDVLTDLASEFMGRGGEAMGQFFTPRDLALLTAQLALSGQLPKLRQQAAAGELVKVSDPTGSGTGSLLLALLYELRKHAPELLPSVGVYAVDLDVGMARATAVQVIWNCLIHQVAIAHVSIWHANAITEYQTKAPMVVYHPRVVNTELFNQRMEDVRHAT